MADLIPVDEKTAEVVKEMLPEDFQSSLNKALIAQAFLVTRDKAGLSRFYVNRTGLLVFMDKKFRSKKARYSIRAELLSQEEEERLRKSLQISEKEPFVAMKGIVEITYEDETKEVFEDVGTASPKDCYHNRLVEMAATRATNRAMRLATSLGFTSVEELPKRENGDNEKNEKRVIEAETVDDLPAKATEEKKVTEKQLKLIHMLINDVARLSESPREEITAEIKQKYQVEHSNELTREQASALIGELQEQLKVIKEQV